LVHSVEYELNYGIDPATGTSKMPYNQEDPGVIIDDLIATGGTAAATDERLVQQIGCENY